MSLGTVAKVWTFQSDSNPDKTYETLQYTDGTTSCGCPGWCRRVAADGSRTCKHTRLVDQDRADAEAVSSKDYAVGTKSKVVSASGALESMTKGTTKKSKAKKVDVDELLTPMDKDLKDLDKNWEGKRRIKWK